MRPLFNNWCVSEFCLVSFSPRSFLYLFFLFFLSSSDLFKYKSFSNLKYFQIWNIFIFEIFSNLNYFQTRKVYKSLSNIERCSRVTSECCKLWGYLAALVLQSENFPSQRNKIPFGFKWKWIFHFNGIADLFVNLSVWKIYNQE